MHPDAAAARGARRRQQDVEVARQLRRHHRAAERDVRQADVDLRRADVALLRAAVVPPAGRRSRGSSANATAGAIRATPRSMLAQEIVARFHSQAAAEHALAEFEARFRDGALPEDMPEVTLQTAGAGLPIAQLAKQAGIVESTSEALRLIAQRGLKVDGDVVADKALAIAAGRTVVVQAGKRKFARVTCRLDRLAAAGARSMPRRLGRHLQRSTRRATSAAPRVIAALFGARPPRDHRHPRRRSLAPRTTGRPRVRAASSSCSATTTSTSSRPTCAARCGTRIATARRRRRCRHVARRRCVLAGPGIRVCTDG